MAIASPTLKVLISSKQAEFAAERADILQTIRPLPLLVANAAEQWPPESTPVERKSVEEASTCAIYVGLFGCVYSEPTVLEYRAASTNPHREILVYVKDCANREPALVPFLNALIEGKTGHTVTRFATWSDVRERFADHLWHAVGRMIDRLLRISSPPRAMGGGGVLQRKWEVERAALAALGLPNDPHEALQMAEYLECERSKRETTR
jgi:hypothetical protein